MWVMLLMLPSFPSMAQYGNLVSDELFRNGTNVDRELTNMDRERTYEITVSNISIENIEENRMFADDELEFTIVLENSFQQEKTRQELLAFTYDANDVSNASDIVDIDLHKVHRNNTYQVSMICESCKEGDQHHIIETSYMDIQQFDPDKLCAGVLFNGVVSMNAFNQCDYSFSWSQNGQSIKFDLRIENISD